VAQTQVAEAEDALATMQVQLSKQTLTAPQAGLISRRLVDVGELAAPQTILLELSNIDTVELTVFIPETQIGQIQLGQQAQVAVDAYPGESFTGRVSFIAAEAEFTPKNVQTQAERVNLVFAVKISLANPDHWLRPGMPADAEILPGTLVEAAPISTPEVQASATPTRRPVSPTPAPSPTPIPVAPVLTPVTIEPTLEAEIIFAGLNVRSGPGTTYPVIAGLVQGDRVPILQVDEANGWLQVQLPESEQLGWISGSPTYVSIK
jgi:hypothetical protein